MKKLLILGAILVTAGVTQAAAFNWKADYVPNQALNNVLNGATANLYCYTLSSVGTDGFYTSLGSATVTSGSISAVTEDLANAVEGTSYSFFFEIDMGEDAGDKRYYTSQTVTVETPKTGNGTVNFAKQFAAESGAVGTWSAKSATQAAPEPTSGLLLLLGMAGLALKRKRA